MRKAINLSLKQETASFDLFDLNLGKDNEPDLHLTSFESISGPESSETDEFSTRRIPRNLMLEQAKGKPLSLENEYDI